MSEHDDDLVGRLRDAYGAGRLVGFKEGLHAAGRRLPVTLEDLGRPRVSFDPRCFLGRHAQLTYYVLPGQGVTSHWPTAVVDPRTGLSLGHPVCCRCGHLIFVDLPR